MFFEGRGTPTRQVGSFSLTRDQTCSAPAPPAPPALEARGALNQGTASEVAVVTVYLPSMFSERSGSDWGQKMSEVCTHPLFFIVSLQERDVFSNCRMTVRI